MQKFGEGDNGKTSLIGDKKVNKNSEIIELLGSIDELSALMQIILTKKISKLTKEILRRVINELAKIASAVASEQDYNCQEMIEKMEKEIVGIDKKLKPINTFITFDNSEIASLINLSRTVCRRVERVCFNLKNTPKEIGAYLNRLSKLLFSLARFEASK